MAVLTPQTITAAGVATTTDNATATTGDTFPIDDRTWVEVKNGSGGSINAVFTSYLPAKDGYTVADKTVAVAAGVTKRVVLDPAAYTDPATGLAKCVCSSVTSVTIAVLRRP